MIVGVDIGGTFTDAVIVRPDAGEIRIIKTLTNVQDPGSRIVEILQSLDNTGEIAVMHATTLTSNILLGQVKLDLPKILLVTNSGFGDVIYIGRQNRTELYSLKPRRVRIPVNIDIFEVKERTLSSGLVEETPSIEDLERLVNKIEKERPNVVCICLLNSYMNPSSEVMIKKYISERVGSSIDIVCSHEITPTCREYERFSTTIISGLLRPLVRTYISSLVNRIKETSKNSTLLMATSWGGVVHPEESIERPVILLESGPAAGVVACAKLCRELGISNVIAFDMGGTTAKFSPIVNFEPELREEYEIAPGVHGSRIQRRIGIPVMVEMLDIVEVSAGGGTIVWIDEAGSIRTGPISAGADPGPACYGRGGLEPTITDANLVLGRIYDKISLGNLKVVKEYAVNAFKKLSRSIGREVEEIAYDAIRKINYEMCRGIKIATVERGLDPREFTLVTYGGAGPLHACEIAEYLGINRIVIPQYSGVFTALGLACMDIIYRYEVPIYKLLSSITIDNLLEDLTGKLSHITDGRIFSKGDTYVEYVLHMRYINQELELRVSIDPADTLESLRGKFEEKYIREYGYTLEDVDIEVTRATIIIRKPSNSIIFNIMRRKDRDREKRNPVIDHVSAFIDGSWEICPVLRRDYLVSGMEVRGPAIIVDDTCTTFLKDGWKLQVDDYGNMFLVRE